MNFEILAGHAFQFVAFCPVFHAEAKGIGRIQANDDCHLMHIARGSGTVFIEDKKYRLRPGTVIAVPPFVRFYFKINAPFEMLNIHYRVKLAGGEALEERAVLPLVFRPEYFKDVLKILRRMENLREKNTPGRLPLAASAHEIVLRHLTGAPLREKERAVIDARLTNACRRLSAPDCATFRATETARLCGLSVSQMNRLFKKCFHMPPHKFWERKRFGELCRQLRFADDSLAQIATRAGFEDNAYFSRWFHKMAGCSPSEFRRRRI
ncbi:MAG: AraC family transcriptional regulator [Kiritimatiellae bacterium]|nr:AraC family transcriptional regulator [Kiritimatiellia bacterium]